MDELFAPEQAAAILQVSPKTLKDWLRAGKLPGCKIGRFWRVKPADLGTFGSEYEWNSYGKLSITVPILREPHHTVPSFPRGGYHSPICSNKAVLASPMRKVSVPGASAPVLAPILSSPAHG